MAELIGMSGDVKGKTYSLEEGDLSIGRSSDNTISINNATVSGHHCRISKDGDKYILRDLGSTNGTRVNTRDITEHPLKPNDLIQAGSIEFLFNVEGEYAPEEQQPSEEDVPARTEVIVSSGPAAAPESFANISPFGRRQHEGGKMWLVAIIILALVALAAVAKLVLSLL